MGGITNRKDTTMKHTPGPWAAHYGDDYCTIYDTNNDEVLTSPCFSDIDRGTFDLIVTCVNACEGMDDPAVEIAKLQSDKAALLEALGDLLDVSIARHPQPGVLRSQLNSGELERRLKSIGYVFSPDGFIQALLKSRAAIAEATP